MPEAEARHNTGAVLEIIVDNRVRFEAKAIPRDALDALKVAFTHKNPDHGKLIAMGRIFAARGVPQVIATWALRDGEFSAPRAGMKRVRAELRKRAIDFRVVDRRTEGEVCARPIVYRGFPLRDHQREMVRIGVERQQCIIRGSTGCGKTTAMLALVEAIGLNTLVILPNKGLFRQWAKCAEVDLGVVGDALGVIGGGKKRLRPLTIALQSSALARNLADCGDFFGAILIDETQRASAKTIYDVVDALPAKYRIGFSASEKRTDRKEFLIYDLIGHAEYEATREQMQEAGHIVGVEIRVVPTKFAAPWYGAHNGETDFNKLLDAMTIDRDRNELIYALLDAEVAAGEQAIVLTHRREHARDVHRRFAATFGTHAKTGLLLGDGEPGDAEEFERSCEGIESGAMLVSAGTYNALGVGINLPAVAVGVAATPISNNEQLVNQVRGRLCRPAQGKREGRLYVPMDVRVYGMKHIRNLLAWNDRVVVRDGERWVEAREWLRRKSFR